jgi:DNA-directed RNA polymerase sigma subunit (sigma70/sigma32)
MYELYNLADGRYLAEVDRELIARRLGWSSNEVDEVEEYLEAEGLVETPSLGGGDSITHPGVLEVEAAMTAPERPTEHFAPATTVVIHGDVIGSQVQAGSNRSSQYVGTASFGEQRAAIDEFIEAFRRAIDEDEMPDADRRRALAAIAAVQPQLELDEPNETMVKEGLRTLRSIAENLAASGLFLGLVELAKHVRV